MLFSKATNTTRPTLVTLSRGVLHPAARSSTPRPLTSTHLMHNLYFDGFPRSGSLAGSSHKTNSAKNLSQQQHKTDGRVCNRARRRHLFGGLAEECCALAAASGSDNRLGSAQAVTPTFNICLFDTAKGLDVSRTLDRVDDVEGFSKGGEGHIKTVTMAGSGRISTHR